MSRTRRVDRYYRFPIQPVSLKCECGKTLARLLDIDDELDGQFLVELEQGPAGESSGWRRIRCGRCPRDWRGQERDIARQIREARTKGWDSKTLV